VRETIIVIGAGLSGAASAWLLMRKGFRVEVYEKADVVGGHVRTEWLRGIPYEPHGAHIFHTYDSSVWQMVSETVEFAPYRHRVLTSVRGHLISWPPQENELRGLTDFEDIVRELATRPGVVDHSNFETYCISLLGFTLYEATVRGYTQKQWGRDPCTLSAAVAEGRIELRADGYVDLFRDPYQGWPRGGYNELVEALLGQAVVHLGSTVTVKDLPTITRPGQPVIVTSALDDFFEEPGTLPWRGIRTEATYLPDTALAQPAMVVNEPAAGIEWTRSIETKWALDELRDRPGTVIMREYPGASAKHYPVLDSAGEHRVTQDALEHRLAGISRNPTYAAGRLATYRYINMDAAIIGGLRAADLVAGRL
jgi:UDP-galactopyranose mutase